MLEKKRLSTTRKGMVGLAPMEAERGDVVVVFLGCGVPLVLTPGEEGLRIVGPAYVHGVMEGEVMELVNKGVLSVELIELG
jgi:hypothetical protein